MSGELTISINTALVASCVVLGFAAHLLKKIIQYRIADPRFTARQYLFAYPYHIGLNICMTLGMTLALQQIGQLNGITAFFCGFASNSIISIFRARIGNAHVTTSGPQGTRVVDPASDD